MIFTELKNVDLAALNKAAMLIQEYASLGYDFVETVWEKDKVENIDPCLKNLGYNIDTKKLKIDFSFSIFKISFEKPQQGPYIFAPINILTAVEAKQLAIQSKNNSQVLKDIRIYLEYGKETITYKVNDINLNSSLLNFLAEKHVKVHHDGDKVKINLTGYW